MSTNPSRTRSFLDRVFELVGTEGTHDLYQNWAQTYEAEIKASRYAGPGRCAVALASYAPDLDAPVLDLGCGTGLSGLALRDAGFTNVDGTDFSEAMLEEAHKKPGIYRRLIGSNINQPIPAKPGQYTHMVAVGVLSPAHAKAELIGQVIRLLPHGGCFAFTLSDHALADPSYMAEVRRLGAEEIAEPVFDEYGDYLPGQDMKASVLVLQRS